MKDVKIFARNFPSTGKIFSLKKTTIGSCLVQDYLQIKILFSCSAGDHAKERR